VEHTGRGHRLVPHTADLRIEAWGSTREDCVAEAVLGAVESFVDTTETDAAVACERLVEAATDEDLLVAVLDELIYLMDTTGQVPAGVVVVPCDVGAEVRFAMVDAERLPQVGAVPKAVSLHELSIIRDDGGWACSVTLDV